MLSHSIRLDANQEINYQYPGNKLITIGSMNKAVEFCPGHLPTPGNQVQEGQTGIHRETKLHAEEVPLKDETERLAARRAPGQKSAYREAENYVPKQSTSVRAKKGKISFHIYRDRSF